MLEFSVLIRRAPDLEGQWNAHCLNWDLVTQGRSPSDALRMILEAIVICVEDDEKQDMDSSERSSAPREYWELFRNTQFNGTRVSPGDIDSKLLEPKNVVLAVVLYMQPVAKADEAHEYAKDAPPAFVVAALRDGDSAACY